MELKIKQFDEPDETRSFPRGRFDVVRIGGVAVGRASYEPGWRWSAHVGPKVGTELCQVAHAGLVVSGRAMVHMKDGTELEIGPGDLFSVPPGHDSWVLGDERYVSLHFLGAEAYAEK